MQVWCLRLKGAKNKEIEIHVCSVPSIGLEWVRAVWTNDQGQHCETHEDQRRLLSTRWAIWLNVYSRWKTDCIDSRHIVGSYYHNFASNTSVVGRWLVEEVLREDCRGSGSGGPWWRGSKHRNQGGDQLTCLLVSVWTTIRDYQPFTCKAGIWPGIHDQD